MRREKKYKTEAIVIRSADLKEKDRIITLLSPKYGKIRAVVKGAKKINGKNIGKFELGSYIHLLIHKGKNLDVVSQCETINQFVNIRDNLDKINTMLHILNRINKWIEEEEENFPLFSLLKNSLTAINTHYSPLIKCAFDIKLLALLGYKIPFGVCRLCKDKGDFTTFSFENEGFVCNRCISKNMKEFKMQISSVKAMQFMEKTPIERIHILKIPKPIENQINTFIDKYTKWHIPQKNKFKEIPL